MSEQEPTFTVTEDYYEDLKSGRGRKLIARKGDVLPWSHAYEFGLVKTKNPPKADETPALPFDATPARKKA